MDKNISRERSKTFVSPNFLVENISLSSKLRSNEFEAYKNDNSAVGNLYLNTVLDFELSKKESQGRFIYIYTDDLRKDLYDLEIIEKLIAFSEKGSLKILTKQIVTDSIGSLTEYIQHVGNTLDHVLKTTFLISKNCFAYELLPHRKSKLNEHEAYFCVNVPDYSKLGEKLKEYKNTIESNGNN